MTFQLDQSNPANALKDMMWMFLMDKGQKANIPVLKGYVYDLIKATTQKDAGQRGTKGNIDWAELDMVLWSIVVEATALVISGVLDEKEASQEHPSVDMKAVRAAMCCMCPGAICPGIPGTPHPEPSPCRLTGKE
jgi:hypothetical protein